MKKLFLIPLLTLMCSVMAWGTEIVVNDFATLKTQLSASGTADVVKLGQDIAYATNGSDLLNIERSLTLDGQGHKISGYGARGSQPNVIAIQPAALADVVLKNLEIYSTQYRPLETRGNIRTLLLENVHVKSTGGTYNSQPFTIGGYQTEEPYAQVTIKNSSFEDTRLSGYPIIIWNPTVLTITDTETTGWSALYFKPDSHGTTVEATNCNFYSPNKHKGATNSFGAFVLEDDGINITLDNCIVNCPLIEGSDQDQAVFCLSDWKDILLENMHLSPCEFTVKGSSTEITGNILTNSWDGTEAECPITFFFYGGTYDDNIEAKIANGVPDGFHVNVLPTVKDGQPITLYRVVKDAEEKEPGVLYNLNDNVEGVAGGENPVTSFDLSTGSEMELNQETTTAGYVQVSDNGDDATIIKVGKVEAETKVNQVLVVNEGLDVQGESQVIVQAGSTLQIGEGGITTEDPENIVIEADESGAASLLLNPEVIVNSTPNLTVEMKVSQAGKDAYGDYWWHRFAMPVGSLPEAWTKSPNYGTYLYGWNYATNDWEQVAGGSTNMQPWKGYTLTYNEAYNENETVTYTFKGNLVGNQDAALTFEEEGYQFFGNSYTGYMDVLTLINQLTDGNIDKSVWMWNPANQTYTAVPLEKLENPSKAARLKDWQKEVAPMQTFIMRLRGATSANETVSYADAIWGNPRYGNSAPAPRRMVASNDDAYMEIVVTAANGQSDRVDFTVNSEYSDAFENGIDASKYMNERHINLYATVAGEDYTSVATDNIEGKTISLQTKNDINYTISFENVETADYALLDKLTNSTVVIAEGNTYEFAAQPNSLVENRFEIVALAKMPTAIENANVKAGAKGIYTIMGQYLGENFDILPAGVYVVNGVKIVK